MIRVAIAMILASVFLWAGHLLHPSQNEHTTKIPVDNTFHKHFVCETSSACLVLAQAIYYEGRGESIEGQIAIAHVILNRVLDGRFPNTIKGVVHQAHQFSYLGGDIPEWYDDVKAYEQARYIASMVLLGLTSDPTNGATHYLNPKKVRRLPKWARKFEQKIVIGNHTFYYG